jgi:hypothetical protein
MTIQLRDTATGRTVKRRAEFTTDHPASHYGIPVLVLSGGKLMEVSDWVLGRGELVRATPTEKANFIAWLVGRMAPADSGAARVERGAGA